MRRHNLSGYYFRQKDANGNWENVCFEELEPEEQKKILLSENCGVEWLRSMVIGLAETVKALGEKFDIYTEE